MPFDIHTSNALQQQLGDRLMASTSPQKAFEKAVRDLAPGDAAWACALDGLLRGLRTEVSEPPKP
ncbi:MAG: hypothetical protein ACTS5I_13430 [Rhodanobacter sp.]